MDNQKENLPLNIVGGLSLLTFAVDAPGWLFQSHSLVRNILEREMVTWGWKPEDAQSSMWIHPAILHLILTLITIWGCGSLRSRISEGIHIVLKIVPLLPGGSLMVNLLSGTAINEFAHSNGQQTQFNGAIPEDTRLAIRNVSVFPSLVCLFIAANLFLQGIAGELTVNTHFLWKLTTCLAYIVLLILVFFNFNFNKKPVRVR